MIKLKVAKWDKDFEATLKADNATLNEFLLDKNETRWSRYDMRERFDDGNIENRPIKIIGFNVLNDKEDQSIYRETVLSSDDFNGKTPEQCVDFAFNKLKMTAALTGKGNSDEPYLVPLFDQTAN